MSRADWPLDHLLQRLRVHALPYRWHESHLNVWLAVCPACRSPEWGLRLTEHGSGGPVTAICASGCSEQTVLHALKAEPVNYRIEHALELAEGVSAIAHRALELVNERAAA